jgi:hypothetical protein
MPRDARATRLRRNAPCALVALVGLTGCVWLGVAPPPEPTLSQPRVEARIDSDLDAAIAEALPDVSYESENPAMTEPLGRADPSLILREVETLDGEARIVCQKRGRNVFGQCVFPPLAAP